jgi:hypothetical protein
MYVHEYMCFGERRREEKEIGYKTELGLLYIRLQNSSRSEICAYKVKDSATLPSLSNEQFKT